MTFDEKLEGFPSVYVINLEESVNRREYMTNQFNKYGIKHYIHTTPRYTTFKEKICVEVDNSHGEIPNLHIGALISLIDVMKHWYSSTDEEYAIFCEDDISFESIDHWNFTWENFISKLPKNWECLQLVRMCSPIELTKIHHLQIDFRWGRWWGSTFMAKRKHIKRLLDIMLLGENHYRITSQDGEYVPCVENCLFLNYNTVCNFPLLFENNFDYNPVEGYDNAYWQTYESRFISNYIIRYFWKTMGSELNLDEIMTEK